MNPVDGTEIYQDSEMKERCRESWQQILEVMDVIGFKPDVSSLINSVVTKKILVHLKAVSFCVGSFSDSCWLGG